MKDYELIEHTADIGIKVKGRNLKELFKNTALSMFDIMAEKKLKVSTRGGFALGKKNEKLKIKIEQKAENLEELFVNWLNELLSLSQTKELIFNDFKIRRLEENELEAEVFGGHIKDYKVNTEIKAATYHELKIEKDKSGWKARVIFDV